MWIWSHRLQVMLGEWAKKKLNFSSWKDAQFWNNEKCNHLDGLLFTIIQILYVTHWWPRWLPVCRSGITSLSVMCKPVASIYSCFLPLLRNSCEGAVGGGAGPGLSPSGLSSLYPYRTEKTRISKGWLNIPVLLQSVKGEGAVFYPAGRW